ncbi:argonaute-like protein [Rhizoctonia solani]|nr:argonaute-like protein [Rhizoctonia solani]
MAANDEQNLPKERNESVDAPSYIPDPAPATRTVPPALSPGVITVGVPRPLQPGTRGVEFTVTTNHFAIDFSDSPIYHYDAIELGYPLPIKRNLEIVRFLQEKVVPTVFTPRGVCNGRKNLFSSRRLPLRGRNGNAQSFNVTLRPPYERPAPRVYPVNLRLVGNIDPGSLKQYCNGKISINNEVLTSFTPLNIILRMKSSLSLTMGVRRLLADREMRSIGGGVELWRGYFISIRPGIRSLIVNVDTSTGTMFAPGPMINVCSQILESQGPLALIPGKSLTDRERLKLQRFLSGVRFVTVDSMSRRHGGGRARVLRGITALGASSLRFINKDGLEITVNQYFLSLGIALRYPEFVCVETSSGAAYPIELCYIVPGQSYRRNIPPHLLAECLAFTRKVPQDRLNSIVASDDVLNHDTSDYMQSFGMTIDSTPKKCLARTLKAPLLDFGENMTHRPENGAWNFKGRKFYKAAQVPGWAMVVYDTRGCKEGVVRQAISHLVSQAARMGIHMDENPPILFPPARAQDVAQHLQSAGQQVYQRYHAPPALLVVVLPSNGADLYQAVKYFGIVARGVATQCLTGNTLRSQGEQYWVNVCLKINTKLGGVNSKLNVFDGASWMFDPECPVMIIASRITHPAPGAAGRPSFVGVVGSLDSDIVRYSAVDSLSSYRSGVMNGLESVVYELIGRHAWWKKNQERQTKSFPERIIYYHSGISDSEFSRVLDVEVPAVKAACGRHKINPKLTVIIVGKRHHVRFFPTHGMEDQTGNCPAGTVVDNVVGNPQEFDFYLQSHHSPAGTSRPMHYSVIYDENDFSQDGMQELTYALCHINARSTRSLSVPAPLHYADRVTACMNSHYDPSIDYHDVEKEEDIQGDKGIQRYHDLFKPVHEGMRYAMYF